MDRMTFRPKYLTKEQVDAIYTQELQNLEAIHIRSGITARRMEVCGVDKWDTEKGEELIEAVRQEWEACRGKE